ncbi:HesA/MoeB/ThiF family protein [uncultured Sanguibacteroides sp.]|uniref:HesA/MoeB/ThiF family protein n=1 Tax=uncultured Sanguibacteroides sp. TaxID=1635151 RepID=UPI0025FA83B3|nr:HesA/MoeB/ThiF family protein [uncultured Sanguibacteroides sp.]
MLTDQEKERYNRQVILSEIGTEGQEKMKQANVLIVGAGGLGSPILLYLTAAGIGHIGIIDNDRVSESNLQRQILYDSTCVNMPKTDIAEQKLKKLNPFCRFTLYETRLVSENASEIISHYDIVVDATDNLVTRYLIDEICSIQKKPMVYGSICEFSGQLSVFHYQGGPSYRKLYPYHDNIQHFTQPLGVVGTLPGIIGVLQANEVIKIILNKPEILSGKLLLVNLLDMSFTKLNL